jgi:pyruvate formate lyase activating enzyme
MTSGILFDIKRFALHDGPGLRTTVFLKGCPLSCLGCHNPEGQGMRPELLFRPDRCNGCRDCLVVCPREALAWEEGPGKEGGSLPGETSSLRLLRDRCDVTGACVGVCLPGALEVVGREWTAAEVLAAVESDRLYYEESGGGVTFSGGEPFAQPDFLRELLEGCRDRDLSTIVDTCGHVSPHDFRAVAPLAGGLLFDVKLVDGDRHEAFTGVHNRWILENLRWLGGGGGNGRGDGDGPSVLVRIPLIPGVNDDEGNLRAAASLLSGLPRVFPVDLLPYHRLGEDKYERMGRSYRLSEVRPPEEGRVLEAARILRREGLSVTIRGENDDHE